MSSVALYVTARLGGWAQPISVSAMHIAVTLWKLTKIAPSSASIELARTLKMVVHLKQTGTLSEGCFSRDLLGSDDFVFK